MGAQRAIRHDDEINGHGPFGPVEAGRPALVGGAPAGLERRGARMIYARLDKAVLRRPLEPGQYTSLRYTDRLDELGIDPSVGSRGDAYDNAMAEAFVGTFKAELVAGRRFPSFQAAEHEALRWIGFYNHDRLHEELGDTPPTEFEERFRPTPHGSFGAVEPDRPALVQGAPVGLGR